MIFRPRLDLLRVALACAPLVACSGKSEPGDGGLRDATVGRDVPRPRDVSAPQDVPEDVAPFDAGPAPECTTSAAVRHVIDRPGGELEGPPEGLIATSDGFLAVLHRRERRTVTDGGTTGVDGSTDAGSGDARSSVELLALGDDGAARGAPSVFYDGAPFGTTSFGASLLPTSSGGFVIFGEAFGTPASPNTRRRLRGGAVSITGVGAAPAVLRERYERPRIVALGSGNFLGLTVRYDPTDAGGPVAVPVALSLAPDGTSLRTPDLTLDNLLPDDASNLMMRRADDGGAYYALRTRGQLGFVRFYPSGQIDAHGVYIVAGRGVPKLDDVASVSDAIVAGWSQQLGDGHTEVHAVVGGPRGALRLDREIENFTGEGGTDVAAVRVYGGVALLWRRGVGAATRVRIAVIGPEGTVRLAPTDLLAAPNVTGRLVAISQGRRVSFLAQDSTAGGTWGYAFGQACVPGL